MGLRGKKKTTKKKEEVVKELPVEETEQVIEVEYDKDLTEDYKKNYIMEEEGIGADEAEPYDIQTTFNTDSLEEMLGEGVEIDSED